MLPWQARLFHTYGRFLQWYHRNTIEGLEHLLSPGPKLGVGYHGRGLPVEGFILSYEVWRHRGYLPHLFANEAMLRLPLFGELLKQSGCLASRGPELEAAIKRGEVL